MSLKVKEFKDMSNAQLKERISELKMELIKHNSQIATGTTPKSPGLVRQTKRNIARIRTVLQEKSQLDINKLEKTKKKELKQEKQEGERKKV